MGNEEEMSKEAGKIRLVGLDKGRINTLEAENVASLRVEFLSNGYLNSIVLDGQAVDVEEVEATDE